MPPAAARAPISLTAATRRGLGGFFLSGLMLAFTGAILPAWGYHLSSEYDLIGRYFLAMSAGIVTAMRLGHPVLKRFGSRRALIAGGALAAASFLLLVFASPPAPAWIRQVALFVIGLAAGLIHAAVFHLITPIYQRAPAETVNLGGILFGSGSLLACLIVAGSIEGYALWIPAAVFVAIVGGFTVWYASRSFQEPPLGSKASSATILTEIRNPAAVLFALVLFFQLGNELSIAGWLALFLVQRLGTSPQAALTLLAIYWFALLAGRVVTQFLLPKVSHNKLLASSLVAALFGCTILGMTNNLFGATIAVLLAGGGFAVIYPLVVEKIGRRFRDHHPAFFGGIFSVALSGGLLAPWLTGVLTSWMGLRAAMLIPAAGICAVFLLMLLIWIEARLHPEV